MRHRAQQNSTSTGRYKRLGVPDRFVVERNINHKQIGGTVLPKARPETRGIVDAGPEQAHDAAFAARPPRRA